MKARLIWVLAALAALAAVVLILFLPRGPFAPSHDSAAVEHGLPKDQAILVGTKAERFGVQKGDVFRYLVEVVYDPSQVSEIDTASLDKSLYLEPFEIRDTIEREFDVDSRTRVYRSEYEIQLITGKVDYLYHLPSFTVRYALRNTGVFSETTVLPEPIFVSSRLPEDIDDLEIGYGPLRPIKVEIQDVTQKRLPWVLWGLGGFAAALAVGDLAWRRTIVQRKRGAEQRTALEQGLLPQAYLSVRGGLTKAVEPKALLHQMDHLLRIVLARKEKSDWLGEPDAELVPLGVRQPVASLLERCQKAYSPEAVEQTEVEQALAELEEILGFYFGEEELEAWRS
jgi:hypothetical protein